MSNIAVVSTFPNNAYDVYGKDFLQSFVKFWPADISLLLGLDNDLLAQNALGILKQNPSRQDSVCIAWDAQHKAFVERNQNRDHPTEYRMQATRFCHKVFTIAQAMAAIKSSHSAPRYLIWLDADVITGAQVTPELLQECLPKEGDAVATLGRKDWDHSECGWLAFDLQNGGDKLIEAVLQLYLTDAVFNMPQWHDSFLWDDTIKRLGLKWTNLTANASGRDVWDQSPMGKWSKHFKGPQAKQELFTQKQGQQQQPQNVKVRIQTVNSIPNEKIREQIARNQELIKNWVRPCKPTDEEIVVVSAGPMLIAEDVRKEIEAGKRIVAVKHALVPLEKAGITPWACILLDPRPHVADFVRNANPKVIWFVASQVHPSVTLELLARGCTVWGYHASVNAGEEALTSKQEYATIYGGSATATRGLYLLNHLGFSKISLYGYDLSHPDKKDLSEIDERGSPKFMEMTITSHDPLWPIKRMFYTEPQLYAQYEEMANILTSKTFDITAHGDGAIPFLLKVQNTVDLRRKALRDKLMGENPPIYSELFNATSPSANGAATGLTAA